MVIDWIPWITEIKIIRIFIILFTNTDFVGPIYYEIFIKTIKINLKKTRKWTSKYWNENDFDKQEKQVL